MEEKKKGNAGLIIVIVILLLVCVGMGAFIYMNKDKLTAKENTTTEEKEDTNSGMFKDETIFANHYETKQEGSEKYFMTLGNMDKKGVSGYFTITYVSLYETGSEAPSTDGYYDIKDGKLKLSVGPYTEESKDQIIETPFKQLSANLEIDPEKDWRNNTTTPSYYKMYQTTYNEEEITIGNKTFYKVK